MKRNNRNGPIRLAATLAISTLIAASCGTGTSDSTEAAAVAETAAADGTVTTVASSASSGAASAAPADGTSYDVTTGVKAAKWSSNVKITYGQIDS